MKEDMKIVKKLGSYTELNLFWRFTSTHHPLSTHPGLQYLLHTRIHSHMMDRITNQNSDHRFAFCTFGAVAVWIKSWISFWNWRSTKLASLIPLNFSVLVAKNLSQGRRCICVGVCPDHNIMPMGTTITCDALAVDTTALKTSLNNVWSTTLPYGTTFGSWSALSLEKSSKSLQTYVQTWPEPLFYTLYDSDFSHSALGLRLDNGHVLHLKWLK